ncbi:unnamed protein product [Adineta steineri]|uniref:Uncharacterized protein n=2 Tax=Adineta steineri TaxID=433720 RepID=A0A815PR86_9BILA|nr:unnamed protein product [Adineta steineri]CAF3882780.1 unnamed protein product [Adineta steineri]
MWSTESTNQIANISGYFEDAYSIFVTENGDIFIDNDIENGHRVERWLSKEDKFEIVMNVSASCYGLFVDINDTLYCSLQHHSKIVKTWLNDKSMIITVVVGESSPSDPSNKITFPCGIFVDDNFDLYVADSGNNRIQLFQLGDSTGKTVAGETSSNPTTALDCPTGIVLDANKYLFIADLMNNRIVGSGPYGFRCLIGCNGQGSESHQLSAPWSLAFDSYGNIFVTDRNNHRIQKFFYIENSCGKFKILL